MRTEYKFFLFPTECEYPISTLYEEPHVYQYGNIMKTLSVHLSIRQSLHIFANIKHQNNKKKKINFIDKKEKRKKKRKLLMW